MKKSYLSFHIFGLILLIGGAVTISAKTTTFFSSFLTDDCSPSKTNNFKVDINCKTTSNVQSTVPLIISEFRLRGLNGPTDEFIEIYNQSMTAHVVAASDASAGYGIAASDGTTRCLIPNGTSIPSRAHFLCVNSAGYGLGGYPAGSATTATGDASYTLDIPDNAGIAIFNNATGGASYSIANRFDAVGATSEANATYKEGTGYGVMSAFSIDSSLVRLTIGNTASNVDTTYPVSAYSVDNDDNAADFKFVDTNGTFNAGQQALGAPGPENLSSPISSVSTPTRTLLDSCFGLGAAPNKVRDQTSNPPNNSSFGTLKLNRTFTNMSGAPITRLRFRVLKITTFPAAAANADLRPITSGDVVVNVDRPPCAAGTSNITVFGTTLEEPPTQPNGGGWNSTMSVGSITTGTPLAAGASIDVGFLFGIEQTGDFAIAFAAEATPSGGTIWWVQGSTDAGSRVNAESGPTAANVSVSGKILDSNGNAIPRAIIQMTDSNGTTRTVKSTTFGYYKFDGVHAGETFTFNVSSKQYQFTPQVLSISDDLAELNFTAQ